MEPTTYYIGDKLNTTGLSVRYTDTAGKTQTITSGFTTNADLSSAGSKQVIVTYQGVSTTFNVTVKTPSVTVTQEELSEGLRLYATTDPAGQDVKSFTLKGRDLEFVESERRVL